MKVALISLGCNKNLVDSEMILGLLDKNGYTTIDDENEADAVIINTCAFIHDAKKESVETILETSKLKDQKCRAIIVTGCLAKRYAEEIRKELPEVDCIAGINDYETIIGFLDTISGKNSKAGITYLNRIRSTMPHMAYVKIADGCDNKCTYCVIPSIRGKYTSRSVEDIEEEVKKLASEGVTEIILTAQDTTYYGLDNYGERSLNRLLKSIEKIDGIEWIRFLYAYPEGITDELIDTVVSSNKICKYFDIPVQHINDEILKKMGRKTSKKDIVNLIEKIRKRVPKSVIRTSLIVGFPGETEDQFNELKEFVSSGHFDRLGVFEYSKEEDTPAAKLKAQLTQKIKRARKDEVMKIQQKVSAMKNKNLIGEKMQVLIEGKMPDSIFFGRTYRDAPEIDGYAFIQSDNELPLGKFIEAEVENSKEYDLIMKKE